MPPRRLLLALVCAVLVACSSGAETADPNALPPDGESVESPSNGQQGSGEGKKVDRGKGKDPADSGKNEAGEPVSRGSDGGSDGSGSDGSSSGNGETAASAGITDQVGDTESTEDPPGYTDIVAAGVEGDEETLRLTITVNDQVPRRMPDAETFFSVDTTIEGKEKPYSVYADGTANGWTAYVTHDGDSRKLPNVFHIEGATTVIEIPWKVIGNQRRFRWSAETSWSRSTLTRTYYSFDEASTPTGARYPGR